MNSKERVVRAVTFQPVDRVPIIPVALMQGSIVLKRRLPEYQQDGHLLAEGQLRLLEMWQHDAVVGIPHVVEDLVPWGSPLTYYENGSPTLSKIVVTRFDQIPDLKVPDPTGSKETKETLKAISGLARQVGSHTPVIGAVIAPFSLPSMLMGTGKWMSLLLDDPGVRTRYLDLLLQKCKQYVVNWAKQQVNAGADIIVLADGMASQTVITRELFERFALPIVRETIKEIPVPVVYEAVGSAQGILDLIATSGALVAILDYKDDLKECKRIAGGKIALMGNFNNIEMIYWNPLKAQLEVKKAIEKAADGYGYILSAQGPEIPYDVKFEVVEAMIKAGKTFGRYETAKIGSAG